MYVDMRSDAYPFCLYLSLCVYIYTHVKKAQLASTFSYSQHYMVHSSFLPSHIYNSFPTVRKHILLIWSTSLFVTNLLLSFSNPAMNPCLTSPEFRYPGLTTSSGWSPWCLLGSNVPNRIPLLACSGYIYTVPPSSPLESGPYAGTMDVSSPT